MDLKEREEVYKQIRVFVTGKDRKPMARDQGKGTEFLVLCPSPGRHDGFEGRMTMTHCESGFVGELRGNTVGDGEERFQTERCPMCSGVGQIWVNEKIIPPEVLEQARKEARSRSS